MDWSGGIACRAYGAGTSVCMLVAALPLGAAGGKPRVADRPEVDWMEEGIWFSPGTLPATGAMPLPMLVGIGAAAPTALVGVTEEDLRAAVLPPFSVRILSSASRAMSDSWSGFRAVAMVQVLPTGVLGVDWSTACLPIRGPNE